ncbi:hypothetical protein [Paraferrimonas sedimenticola]|uniref:Uncharacterized protein n=1 Tax=Paraferrimonas sedimenticola TaxID=375674 RepID=A0AA37RTE8_9GAMM|nr:hypothetical protein [Paraferrimonas sedimenticola]GLP95133.1 hypothetical protein GCM10007895_04390 [Paraferrimonas sedimenticola]
MRNIAIALLALTLLATVISLFTQVGVMSLMLVPLGVVTAVFASFIGIPLAIDIYGLPAILSLAFALVSLPLGLFYHRKPLGQVSAVLGCVVYVLLSIAGLGNAG